MAVLKVPPESPPRISTAVTELAMSYCPANAYMMVKTKIHLRGMLAIYREL